MIRIQKENKYTQKHTDSQGTVYSVQLYYSPHPDPYRKDEYEISVINAKGREIGEWPPQFYKTEKEAYEHMVLLIQKKEMEYKELIEFEKALIIVGIAYDKINEGIKQKELETGRTATKDEKKEIKDIFWGEKEQEASDKLIDNKQRKGMDALEKEYGRYERPFDMWSKNKKKLLKKYKNILF